MKRFATILLALAAGCTAPRFEGPGAPVQTIENRDVVFVAVGADTFDARRLLDVAQGDLERFPKAANRRAVLDDAAFAMTRFYQAQGFATAQVEFELDQQKVPPTVTFRVREGPRTLIEALQFHGHDAYTDKELRTLYEVPRIAGKDVYVESELNDLVRAIAKLYVSTGFAKVRVETPAVKLDKSGTRARVDVVIHEGKRYLIREVAFDGELDGAAKELEDLAREQRGVRFTPERAGTVSSKAAEILSNHGFPDARARTSGEQFDDASGHVDLAITIQTGVRVKISDIVVRGNRRVPTDLILSRIHFEPGDMYQSDKERDSMRALYRMGLFSTVKLTLEGDQPVRRLAVDVVETWSREFYVQPGYGSYERLRVALGWRDKDWFGTARILNVEATLSELAQRGQASLSDLHLFGHDVEGTASLFAGRRQEPSFLSNEAGGSFAVTRHFTEHIHGIVGYQFRRSGISDVDPNAPPPATQDVNISSVLGTANWDTRDDPFVPRSGTFAQLSVEYAAQAIGSQIDFVRNRWTLSQFIPAGSGFVLGGSWRGGVIAPFGITDTIPLQERFFNGGENTVRCFREDEIGPLDSQGFSLGGEAFNVFSVEGRQRLHSLWDRVPNSFDAGLFVDAGNVEPRADKFWDFRDMRWGPGVGVRYLLPVGPIRLDLGYNPDQRPGEARWVLHLSVGMSF